MSDTTTIRRGPTTFGVIRSGGKPVKVVRAVLPPKKAVMVVAASIKAPEPDRTGAIAVDCENALRGKPLRFPVDFIPSACVGVR